MILYVFLTLSFSLLPLLLPLIVIVVHNFHDHHIHFHNSTFSQVLLQDQVM